MQSADTCCTLVPYFTVADGKLDEFKALCDQFVALTRNEPGCVHYAFSFDGQTAHCREGYDDAAALLAHLGNVDAVLQQALKIAQIARLEVHAPAAQLDALRGPLAGLSRRSEDPCATGQRRRLKLRPTLARFARSFALA